ncbi:MAG: transporter substrate-binding domain-containing protein [Campylobacteraceae bacterium]|jgi:putative glutamine transport system substrate-binding protein|nr:transporter substrate-binding domain-containing protein [Campylobacteraceae bacterium]
MKKFIFLASLIIFAGCSLAYINSSKGVQNILDRGAFLVGVKTDVPKFGYQNPSNDIIDGFEIDIAKAVAKKILGEEGGIELIPVTIKTREDALERGEVDVVIATFSITEERQSLYDFSDAYYTDGVALMVKNGSNIKSFNDLDGKSVGIIYDATSKAILQEKARNSDIKIKFFSFRTYSEVKSALNSGMIDCFSADKSILLGYQTKNTVILDDILSEERYGIASKKGDAALAKIINDAVNELKTSGELDKMAKKWGL